MLGKPGLQCRPQTRLKSKDRRSFLLDLKIGGPWILEQTFYCRCTFLTDIVKSGESQYHPTHRSISNHNICHSPVMMQIIIVLIVGPNNPARAARGQLQITPHYHGAFPIYWPVAPANSNGQIPDMAVWLNTTR